MSAIVSNTRNFSLSRPPLRAGTVGYLCLEHLFKVHPAATKATDMCRYLKGGYTSPYRLKGYIERLQALKYITVADGRDGDIHITQLGQRFMQSKQPDPEEAPEPVPVAPARTLPEWRPLNLALLPSIHGRRS